MLQRGINIMVNQVNTPIQNYFEKALYENLTFLPCGFSSYQSPVNRLHVNKESNHVMTL